MTLRFALSQAPEHVEGKDSEPPGFATHMLPLAKPPSMSKGREKHDEGGVSGRLIADDCLKHLFIKSEKRVQEKEIHSLNLKLFYG
jgi:hypothetical protein